jgi:hypothetical protein
MRGRLESIESEIRATLPAPFVLSLSQHEWRAGDMGFG